MKPLSLALTLSVLAVAPAPAQDFRAKLNVTVIDPSGSSVPGAQLPLKRTSLQDGAAR